MFSILEGTGVYDAKFDPSYLKTIIGNQEDKNPETIAFINSQVKGIDFSQISDSLRDKYDWHLNRIEIVCDSNFEVYPQIHIEYLTLRPMFLENLTEPPQDLMEDIFLGLTKMGLGKLLRMYHISNVSLYE